MKNKDSIVSVNVVLKPPITVHHGEHDYSVYIYKQTLKEMIEEEYENILFLEDKFFLYHSIEDVWYRSKHK